MKKKGKQPRPARPAAKGRKAKPRVRVEPPADETDAECRETERYVETLEANRQLDHGAGPLPPGSTHQVEPDESGGGRVVRKRYSSF